MNKYIVVSTNNNPDYMFYAPFIEKAWNKYGWSLAVVVTADVDEKDLKLVNPSSVVIRMPDIPSIRKETIAQAGRLYAANHFEDGETLLMTSDMDLLPLSDYWHPDPNNITVYGHDLTWYSFYPMGYIAMTASNWRNYMKLFGDTGRELLRDANDKNFEAHNPLSNDWETWWGFDWHMITTKLSPYKDRITFINRGQVQVAGNTLALGRVDRFNFDATLLNCESTNTYIDCHAENNNVRHESKLNKFISLFEKFYGK